MLTIYLITQFALILKNMKIRASEILALAGILAAFVIASVWIQGGGLMLYGEADLFLIDHNTPERSFWNKILCPHQHDADAYLAREITHAVEHIDARFVHWSIARGWIHFMSVSTYGFFCGIAGIAWFFMRRNGWPNWFAMLAIAVFLSAPPIILGGTYIRPGHAHAAFWAVVYLFAIWARPKKWQWLTLLLPALAMVWADRQGLFVALACILVFGLLGDGWMRKAAAAAAAAVVVHSSWMVFVGPKLIDRFTDFKVGAHYQSEPFFRAVPILLSNGWDGFLIALNNVAMLFGNVSLGVAFAVVLAAAWSWKSLSRVSESSAFILSRPKWFLSMPIVMLALGSGMYGLILHRQSALIWPDLFSTAYYLIVGTVLVWLAALWYVQSVRYRYMGDARVEWTIAAIMAAIVIGNVSGIRGHVQTMRSGHLAGFIAGAPFLKAKLKQVAETPTGTNTNRYDVKASSHFTEFKHIMKNPMEYRQMSGDEFAESSQYLQWFRSEKRLAFGKGGREQ